MIKRYVFVLPLVFLLFACQAKINGDGAIRSTDEVVKATRPELKIEGASITFNNAPLKLGASLVDWKKVLGGRSRCDDTPPGPVLCIWDELGISVGTGIARPTVKYINVYVSLEPKDTSSSLFATNPDGSPSKALPDLAPTVSFPGYLKLDRVTIDATTSFKEIRANADRNRALRCGTRDCSHPIGMFSKSAAIYMRLNSRDENGTLYELMISED